MNISAGKKCLVVMVLSCSGWHGTARGQSSWPGYPNNSVISITGQSSVEVGGPVTMPNASWLAFKGSGGTAVNTLGMGTDNNLYFGDLFGASPSTGLIFRTDGTNAMVVTGTGKIGIGTSNPQHLLQVSGTIGAQEILVTSTGADYVFENGYRLKPLTEVKAYIDANHHLPDVPPAEAFQREGVGVGEMQAKLLAKIEELTLHLIRQEQENNALREQNRSIEERMLRLEAAEAAKQSNREPNGSNPVERN